MLKKLTVLTFLITTFIGFSAPVIFYNSYKEYTDKTGQNKGEFQKLSISDTKTSITVLENDKKAVYSNKQLETPWAIEIEGVLFKYYKGQLLEVLYLGEKVSVYEGAHNRIEALNEGKPYTPGMINHEILYFSKGTDGTIDLLLTTLKGKVKENLRTKYSDFAILFDRIEAVFHDRKNYTTQKVLQVFKDFDQEK